MQGYGSAPGRVNIARGIIGKTIKSAKVPATKKMSPRTPTAAIISKRAVK